MWIGSLEKNWGEENEKTKERYRRQKDTGLLASKLTKSDWSL